MSSTQAGIVDLESRRPHEKAKAESISAAVAPQHNSDVFSSAFFAFWPGMAWMPLPFDSRPAEQRRVRD